MRNSVKLKNGGRSLTGIFCFEHSFPEFLLRPDVKSESNIDASLIYGWIFIANASGIYTRPMVFEIENYIRLKQRMASVNILPASQV